MQGLLNTDCWVPPPEFQIHYIWGGAKEFEFSNKFPGNANIGNSETTLGEVPL